MERRELRFDWIHVAPPGEASLSAYWELEIAQWRGAIVGTPSLRILVSDARVP
jgi:hypothetical protein